VQHITYSKELRLYSIGPRVRRFFGKPKKTRCFLKTEILDITFGEKPENRGKTGKNEEKSVFY
jgi:hypothetical protein